jgi:hypothetical protein
MTPETARMVQLSFQRVLPYGDELIEAVFLRLAEAEPRLAPLFPAESAAHRRRFLAGLGFAIEGLDDVGQMAHGLRGLGAVCRRAGLGDGELAVIEAALLDTIGQALGGQARGSLWTEELQAAWAEAAATLGAAMRQRAARGRAAA